MVWYFSSTVFASTLRLWFFFIFSLHLPICSLLVLSVSEGSCHVFKDIGYQSLLFIHQLQGETWSCHVYGLLRWQPGFTAFLRLRRIPLMRFLFLFSVCLWFCFSLFFLATFFSLFYGPPPPLPVCPTVCLSTAVLSTAVMLFLWFNHQYWRECW